MRTPKPPPRITEVNADPDRPHTPPPPAMPMAPPRAYAAPRGRLPSHHDVEIAEESDEGDRPSRLEQEAFAEAVHIQHKGFRAHIPAVVVSGIIAAASAYLLKPKESATPTTSVQCLTKDQFDESMRTRDERVSRRFDTLETDTSYLKVAVRLVQDRLPAQK